MPGNVCVGNNGASTDWAYVNQREGHHAQYPRRTASLSRNLTRRSRSVTMPNMKENGNGTGGPSPSPSCHNNNSSSSSSAAVSDQQFSTFKRPNSMVGMIIFLSFLGGITGDFSIASETRDP